MLHWFCHVFGEYYSVMSDLQGVPPSTEVLNPVVRVYI